MGLGNQFTTFMKARIFCEREVPPGRQFAGTVDFQYNEISELKYCIKLLHVLFPAFQYMLKRSMSLSIRPDYDATKL